MKRRSTFVDILIAFIAQNGGEMKRLAGALFLAASIVALRSIALCGPAPALENEPLARTFAALASDGIVDSAALRANPTSDRYAMAVLAARAVAKVEAGGASAQDLLRVQHLMNALRDQLDALGVRSTTVGEARGAIEARTRAARKSIADDVQAQIAVREPPADFSRLPAMRLRFAPSTPMQSSIAGLALRISPEAMSAASATSNGGTDAVYLSITRTLDSVHDGYVAFGSSQGVQRMQSAFRMTSAQTGTTFGLSYSRIFDRPGSLPLSPVAVGGTLVSNAVFGIDFTTPVFARSGLRPSVFAEGASSSFSTAPRSADALASPALQAWADNALVAGINFHIREITGSVQYQVVGTNFSNVTADEYFGSAPDFFAFEARSYAPQIGPLAGLVTPQPSTRPDFASAYADSNPLFENLSPDVHSAFTPGSQGVNVALSSPVRIGSLTLQGNIAAAHIQETTPNSFAGMQYCTGTTPGCTFYSNQRATDDRLAAGTTFHLRAWGRPVALDLGASVERLSRDDRTAFTSVPASLPAVSSGSPITFNPNYVDVTQRSLHAAAVVPLSRDLTLGVQYNTQFFTGSYAALGQNIDQRKDLYLGNVTYTIPRTASAIVFSAKQYRYHDAFVPANNLTQNRADLNFTVKF